LSLAGYSGELLPFIPGEKIERKENKQDQKNSHRPQQTLPETISVLLGVVVNPKGNNQVDGKKDIHCCVSNPGGVTGFSSHRGRRELREKN
jgi:hypothetical protein